MNNLVSFQWLLITFFMKLIYGERKVAMNEDLCRRFPQLDFCRNPPALPPTPDNQPLDRETYCRKYQLHFTYFCTTDDNQVANSKEFCSAYKNKCDTKDAPSLWSPEQIKEQCNKRRALAEQFCLGNESPSIKSDCDLYRQYCKGQDTAPVATIAPVVDLNQYCRTNYPRYVSECGGGQVPQQPQAIQPPLQQQQIQQPQLPSSAAGLTPDQINTLCTQNKALASQFCKGNEDASIRPKCDAFRQYCVGGSGRKRRQVVGPLIGTSSAFCGEFVQNCNNLPAGQNNQLAVFCQRYAFTVDTFCPAYEIAENRIACNSHRVYCQNKPPFRDIDGVTGV